MTRAEPARRISAILPALLLAACAAAPPAPPVEAGAVIRVVPVRNLSGVPLDVPEIWLGDAGEKAAGMEFDTIDLRLLAEAGLRARLDQLGHGHEDAARHELHAAISRFELTELRRTGRIRLGLSLLLVDTTSAQVVGQAEVLEYCQLMDRPPAETGIVGEQRFVRRRLEIFMEGLTRQALFELGFTPVP